MSLPKHKKIKNILIICEGDEELDYLNRLKDLKVFNKNFSLENAGSISKISSKYIFHDHINDYRNIYVICDAEKEPYSELKKILKETNRKNVFFVNPCTLQLQILHFTNDYIRTSDKSKNSKIIKKIFGIDDYRATKDQRDKINKMINEENFNQMIERLKNISKKLEDVPSSNIIELFNKLK